MMKRGSSLLEWIIIISIVGILTTQAIPKNNLSKIKLAKNQILLHLKYTRYIAMLDNKYDSEDPMWFKKRWNVKFENCDKDVAGVFYMIYSDEDKNGYVKKVESLKDPLTNNYIYASNCKKDSLYDKSSFVLLTQKYGVDRVDISCNHTRETIGLLSFGIDGNVYSDFDIDDEKYKIDEKCIITLQNKQNESETIIIHPNSGFIEG